MTGDIAYALNSIKKEYINQAIKCFAHNLDCLNNKDITSFLGAFDFVRGVEIELFRKIFLMDIENGKLGTDAPEKYLDGIELRDRKRQEGGGEVPEVKKN